MNHADHVNLIRDGVLGGGNVWADLGSGSGAFTSALADLLGSGGHVYAVDQNPRVLRDQGSRLRDQFPGAQLYQVVADFTQPLSLPLLDGVVAANSLHFVRDKGHVLGLIHEALAPGGRLVVVEYNTDRGNHWVPSPFSYETFLSMVSDAGFVGARLLAVRPSRFLGEIYSAVAFRSEA